MKEAIDVLKAAFLTMDSEAPQRARYSTASADLLVMPAWNARALGVKLVTVNPANPQRRLSLIHALYVLFDGRTSRPVALLDGEELTRIRTAALSGLATRCLSDPAAENLVVFGAGKQAEGHIEAMCTVASIRKITIVSRSKDRASSLARITSERMGVDTLVGESDAVRAADLVCTCTTSASPVFDGSLLEGRTHVNAVGSYRPDARELDDATMRQAAEVVVESRGTALAEAGDVLLAMRSGALDGERLIELRDLIRDGSPGESRDGVTVFKSVGMAMEDLAVAQAALARAPHQRE